VKWQLQEAKQKFSELVQRVLAKGPRWLPAGVRMSWW